MHKEEKDEMQRLFEKYLGAAEPTSRATVLDVGSLDVNGSYRQQIEALGYNYEGCDIRAGKNVDHIVTLIGTESIFDWPDEPAVYDHIISGSCFEHCKNPFALIEECSFVLKPGGYLILNAPFIWHEHDHPYDCFRYLPSGFDALFEYVNFEKVETYLLEYRGKAVCFGVARKK